MKLALLLLFLRGTLEESPPSGEVVLNNTDVGARPLFPLRITRRLSVVNVGPTDDLVSVLAAASAGDEIVLADGTYTPTADGENALVINKDITIRAQNHGQAVLDGQDSRRVIKIESGTVALEGLTITRGSASSVCASTSKPEHPIDPMG